MIDKYTKATLIGYTQPADDFKESFSSAKDLVAYCARVSSPSNQFNSATSDKLINYLIKHKHWSPLEMCSATIEVETTRDIARQLLRHRSFAFQEFSQRYADPTKDLSFVIREARYQDTKNRQNSLELDLSDSNQRELNAIWEEKQRKVISAAIDAYQFAVKNNIAKEQARSVLPEGNTMSRLYVQGTIRSFIHYIDVRKDESTQKEHRVLAECVAGAISKVFSVSAVSN